MANIEEGLTVSSYVAGSYKGNGLNLEEGGQSINLGFRPRFVIISRGWTSNGKPSSGFMAVGPITLVSLHELFTWTGNGLWVAVPTSTTVTMELNTSGYNYGYIAFR